MRFRAASILSAAALTATALLASGSANAVERLPWDANLRVTDLQQESVTVAWNKRAQAMHYSVGVQPLEACDTYQSLSTKDRTATITGLTPDCRYRIYVVAVVTLTQPYLNPIAEIEVTTPPPDGYTFPEPPGNLRAELSDGKVTGFAWDAANVSVGPVKYRFYTEPVLITNPFATVTQTSLGSPDLDYFLGVIGAEGFSTVTVWVTTVDGIHNESAPSDELVLNCRPDRSIHGASCEPA